MDLNHVAIFVRVVESESFTAAAAALGLPKSSVSRSVTHLEEDIGVRLLQRTTRRLSLTDAGRTYFTRAKEAIAGIDEATAEVADMGKEPRGVVRVTAPADLAITVLTRLIGDFIKKHPNIHVELSVSSRRVDLVEEGFDLALRAGKLEDSTLIARKLASSSLGLFASPAYLRKAGRPKTLADLADHECILFRARGGRATWKFTGPTGEEESVEVHGPVSSDEMLVIQRACDANLGIAALPLFTVTRCAKHSDVVRVLPEYEQHGGALYLLSPTVRHEPARVGLFREFLAKSFSGLGLDPD